MTENKGKLHNACCYLSGPMEYVADHGVIWRRKFIQLTKDANLRIDFIDPTNKPGGKDIKIGENKEFQAALQREGKFKELQDYVDSYRRYDLRFVDLSDFLIAVIDPTIPMWGTSNEIYEAERQHKPIFLIIEGGMYKLPRWLFGVVDVGDDPLHPCNVFESLEALIERLKALDSDDSPMSNKWVLVRNYIEQHRVET